VRATATSCYPECVCCGGSAAREGEDVWEGRLDGFCDACASARCDTTDSECPRKGTVALKLEQHDEFAPAAVRYIIDWLRHEPEPLLAMARGRHAEGHYRFGDKLMFEHSQETLLAEAAQEIADAVCYLSLLLRRAA
jgi:hypothetical protein